MTQVRKFTVFPKSKIFRPFNKPWKKPPNSVSSYLQSMRSGPQCQDSGNHPSGYLMLLQNIPTVPTLQINSHSPLHIPSLRSSRAHKLPSQASQPYLCYRQAVRCPYTGLPAQLIHEHSPKLSVGAAHPPQPSSGLCLASCSPTEPQSPRRPCNGKGVCPQGMQVSQKIPDTRMKCAFERLMPTHHTNNWLSSS